MTQSKDEPELSAPVGSSIRRRRRVCDRLDSRELDDMQEGDGGDELIGLIVEVRERDFRLLRRPPQEAQPALESLLR